MNMIVSLSMVEVEITMKIVFSEKFFESGMFAL